MNQAYQYLVGADPVLAEVLLRVGPLQENKPARARPQDHFAALARIVVGQQLSTRVAEVIWSRVETHFQGSVTSDVLLATAVEELRTLGLSGAKAKYLHALALHHRDGLLVLEGLEQKTEAEVRETITAIKGFGPWSADMFLMFHLHHPDVLPVGDLGIREAMRRLYGLAEKPLPPEMERIAAPWRPHRTLASLYLWRSLDAVPVQTASS